MHTVNINPEYSDKVLYEIISLATDDLTLIYDTDASIIHSTCSAYSHLNDTITLSLNISQEYWKTFHEHLHFKCAHSHTRCL